MNHPLKFEIHSLSNYSLRQNLKKEILIGQVQLDIFMTTSISFDIVIINDYVFLSCDNISII